MTLTDWIDWTQEQLGDLSRRLVQQGYHPDRVFYLEENEPEFKDRFHAFMGRIGVIIDSISANPEGYQHFDAFLEAKMDFLKYANHHRARFLGLESPDLPVESEEIAA